MRVGRPVLGTVLVCAAAWPAAADARPVRQFYLAGSTGKVTAVIDSRNAAAGRAGHPDITHATLSYSWKAAKPGPGSSLPTLVVPLSGSVKPANIFVTYRKLAGTLTVKANGKSWQRGRYATWKCSAVSTLKSTMAVTPVATGSQTYDVTAAPLRRFTGDINPQRDCTTRPDLAPSRVVVSGARVVKAVRFSRGLLAADLRARTRLLRFARRSEVFDCHAAGVPTCTTRIGGTATLKLAKACKDGSASVKRNGVIACRAAYPEPR